MKQAAESTTTGDNSFLPTWKFFNPDSYQSKMLLRTTIAPSVVALMERIITHPLDTVITYQQQQNINFLKSGRYIFNNYGFWGFYRGLSLPLLMSSPPGAIIVYGSYEGLKTTMAQYGFANATINAFTSSLITALTCSVIATPIESKRIRDTFKIVVDDKRSALYYHFRGFVPMALKFCLHAPIVLAGTDVIKSSLNTYGKDSEYAAVRMLADSNHSYSAFVGGLVTGIFSQFITTPIDVIKTKVMSDYGQHRLSFWQHSVKAFKEKSLLQSMGSRVVKFGLHSSVMLGFMHMITRYFEDKAQNVDQDSKQDKKFSPKV